MALFYKSEAGSLVPTTSIKAIKDDRVILLTGDKIKLTKPVSEKDFIQIHGAEDSDVEGIYHVITDVVNQLAETQETMRQYNATITREIDTMRNTVNKRLDQISRDSAEAVKESKEAMETTNHAAEQMSRASRSVRELGETVNETLSELKASIADTYSL